MTRRLNFALSIALGIGIIGLGLGTAAAHKASYPTTVKVSETSVADVNGAITSREKACLKGRTVRIGSPATGEIGSATTAADGSWVVNAGIENGRMLQAKVDQKVVKRGKHKHTCLAGSKRFTPPV